MKKSLCLLLAASLAALAETAVPLKIVSDAAFDHVNAKGTFSGWTYNAIPCTDNPQSGKYCARQKSNGSNWDCMMHADLMRIKPDTRYRVTFWNRNTLTDGWAKFGIRFCDKTKETMRVLDRVGYNWCSVKPGQTEWKQYTMEFTTPHDVAYINIHLQVSKPVGDVFWDSIEFFEIQP